MTAPGIEATYACVSPPSTISASRPAAAKRWPRLVRIPVGEQRRFGEPPGVGSRHRRGARVERHGLVAVEVAIAGVGLGMEDESKVGIGARSLHG